MVSLTEVIYFPDSLPAGLIDDLRQNNIVPTYPYSRIVIESLQYLYMLASMFEHYGFELIIGNGFLKVR